MSKMRSTFDFSAIKLNWFPGHMATSARQIRGRISRDVDLIVEVRDARIPLSSRNSYLLEAVASKPRIVVYNKSDLADFSCNRRFLQNWNIEDKGGSGADLTRFLMSSYEKRSINDLLTLIKSTH